MKAVVVEDRGTFGPALVRRLQPLGVQAHWIPHPVALEAATVTWSQVPMVLLDALDLSSQQDDHTRSRLSSLDLIERMAYLPADRRPLIVAYSTQMARPEVDIPLRRSGSVAAFYEVAALVDCLPQIVLGRFPDQVAPPSEADWDSLHPGLRPASDVASAHQLMRKHDRAWRQVWDHDAPFDKAAQVWIRRNVLGLLGLATSGYGVAVEVTRRLAGLPYNRH
jgi:hypothetical protein